MSARKRHVGRLAWVAALAISACPVREDPARREFVEQYVRSVALGTDFHRHHTEPGREAVAPETREWMTDHFEVVGWDRFAIVGCGRMFGGSGQYEYYIRFSNGATGVLYVAETADRRFASLVVSAPPRKGPDRRAPTEGPDREFPMGTATESDGSGGPRP